MRVIQNAVVRNFQIESGSSALLCPISFSTWSALKTAVGNYKVDSTAPSISVTRTSWSLLHDWINQLGYGRSSLRFVSTLCANRLSIPSAPMLITGHSMLSLMLYARFLNLSSNVTAPSVPYAH